MKRTNVIKTSILLSILAFILFIPNMVNAQIINNDNIKVETSKLSSDGSIKVELTGITLDETHEYYFSLCKTTGVVPTTDYLITTYTSNSATINLNASTKEICDVLKSTDKGYLYVWDYDTDESVIEKLPINLKMKPYEAIEMNYDGLLSWDRIYGIKNSSYKFEKITDTNIINTYLKNNRKAESIYDLLPKEPTKGGFKNMFLDSYSPYCYEVDSRARNEKGLWLIWGQIYGDGAKTIYGYSLYDNMPIDNEAPIVKSIEVVSPEAGTYKTSQTVKIRVNFDEIITADTVPTLKVRFGESPIRDLTNGTIVDHYIEYSYNIQDNDKGQLATVALEGGNVKDSSGNSASISCPIISGNAIKANVDGIENNNTENQDTNNNNKGENNSNNNNSNNTNNNKQENDNTQAPNKIPQAGQNITIVLIIAIVLVSGIVMLKKYQKYKGI